MDQQNSITQHRGYLSGAPRILPVPRSLKRLDSTLNPERMGLVEPVRAEDGAPLGISSASGSRELPQGKGGLIRGCCCGACGGGRGSNASGRAKAKPSRTARLRLFASVALIAGVVGFFFFIALAPDYVERVLGGLMVAFIVMSVLNWVTDDQEPA